MSEVRVSVVVPAYNAERTLGACLEALTRQVRPADEVVVVDNGSTDGTAAVAHAFCGRLSGLRVVVEPRAGEAAARNRGLEEARGDVIAFTDADCIPREDWLDQAVRALGAWPECAAVAGEVAGYRPGRLVEKYLSVAAFPTPQQPCVVSGLGFPPPTFYTANFVVRRAALARVGRFDESLTVGLDVDLCVRLLRAGFRIGYQPGAVVAHVQRDSLRKMMRRLFQYGTGVPAWFRKYAEAGVWLTLPGRRAVRISWMPWRGLGEPVHARPLRLCPRPGYRGGALARRGAPGLPGPAGMEADGRRAPPGGRSRTVGTSGGAASARGGVRRVHRGEYIRFAAPARPLRGVRRRCAGSAVS
jgi:glycosyltransferase involved in cell wall biosynthesis